MKIPTLDRYWETLDASLPVFAPDEQRMAVTLYRELAKGLPVTVDQLAEALEVSSATASELLSRDSLRGFVYADDGRVVGFGGLAAASMHHRFEIDGRCSTRTSAAPGNRRGVGRRRISEIWRGMRSRACVCCGMTPGSLRQR